MAETTGEISSRIITGIGQASRGKSDAMDAIRALMMQRDELDKEIEARLGELKAIFGEIDLEEPADESNGRKNGRKKKMKYFQHPKRDKDSDFTAQKRNKSGKFECKTCHDTFGTLQGVNLHGRRKGHKSGHEKSS